VLYYHGCRVCRKFGALYNPKFPDVYKISNTLPTEWSSCVENLGYHTTEIASCVNLPTLRETCSCLRYNLLGNNTFRCISANFHPLSGQVGSRRCQNNVGMPVRALLFSVVCQNKALLRREFRAAMSNPNDLLSQTLCHYLN